MLKMQARLIWFAWIFSSVYGTVNIFKTLSLKFGPLYLTPRVVSKVSCKAFCKECKPATCVLQMVSFWIMTAVATEKGLQSPSPAPFSDPKSFWRGCYSARLRNPCLCTWVSLMGQIVHPETIAGWENGVGERLKLLLCACSSQDPNQAPHAGELRRTCKSCVTINSLFLMSDPPRTFFCWSFSASCQISLSLMHVLFTNFSVSIFGVE